MPGLGTIVNVLAIIAGGLLGMTGGRFLTEKIQNTVITTAGICAMFLGTGSALARMLTLENGVLNTQGTMMMIGCLILGVLTNGMQMIGLDVNSQYVVKGIILMASIGYDTYQQQAKVKKAAKKA